MYGHIRCIHTVMANPINKHTTYIITSIHEYVLANPVCNSNLLAKPHILYSHTVLSSCCKACWPSLTSCTYTLCCFFSHFHTVVKPAGQAFLLCFHTVLCFHMFWVHAVLQFHTVLWNLLAKPLLFFTLCIPTVHFHAVLHFHTMLCALTKTKQRKQGILRRQRKPLPTISIMKISHWSRALEYSFTRKEKENVMGLVRVAIAGLA